MVLQKIQALISLKILFKSKHVCKARNENVALNYTQCFMNL